MLASILGTLAPAVGHLRHIAAVQGEPFSIRGWIRQGAGSLWLPYTANQVAALIRSACRFTSTADTRIAVLNGSPPCSKSSASSLSTTVFD